MPRFSIIIPCFNKERFVEETLKSCQSQTAKDWEAIVVDDVSTDGSVAVVQRMIKADPRIRLIRQKRRQGPSIARNVGLKAAKGKYINYLDADDIIEPEKLKLQGEVLDKDKKVGIVLGRGITIDEKGRLMDKNYLTEGHFRGHPPLQNILFRGGLFPPAAMLCRRKDAMAIGGFWPKGFWCEDLEFFIRLARTGVDYVVLPKVLFRYRRTSGSWGSNADNMEKGHVEVYAKLMKEDPYQSALGLRTLQGILGYMEARVAKGKNSVAMAQLLQLVAAWLNAQKSDNSRSLVMWGAGSGGQRILALMSSLGVKVSAFVDRDPAKAGTRLNGLPIITPDDVLPQAQDRRPFVIVASTFAAQIKKQLQQAGWAPHEDFYIFDFDMAVTLENVLGTDETPKKLTARRKPAVYAHI